MTLQEWANMSPIDVRVFDRAGVYTVADARAIDHIRTYLFGLDDAKVSSVTGGTIWLRGPAYAGAGHWLLTLKTHQDCARASRPKRTYTATRHTVCRYCGQDIEGWAPYRKGEWRDRGNNRHCPTPEGDAGRLHTPVRDFRTYDTVMELGRS
jgi:hypothetical protein